MCVGGITLLRQGHSFLSLYHQEKDKMLFYIVVKSRSNEKVHVYISWIYTSTSLQHGLSQYGWDPNWAFVTLFPI